MRRYRVLLPLLVHTEDGSFAQGEEFEKDFSADDEATNLESGLLALVPCEYKVVGDTRVYDTEPGGTFTAALTIGQEQHLVDAGHVERVEAPVTTKRKKEAKT